MKVRHTYTTDSTDNSSGSRDISRAYTSGAKVTRMTVFSTKQINFVLHCTLCLKKNVPPLNCL